MVFNSTAIICPIHNNHSAIFNSPWIFAVNSYNLKTNIDKANKYVTENLRVHIGGVPLQEPCFKHSLVLFPFII